jgi:hypothetical protein
VSTELDMLKISVNASAQRIAKLRQSVAKVQLLFPLSIVSKNVS